MTIPITTHTAGTEEWLAASERLSITAEFPIAFGANSSGQAEFRSDLVNLVVGSDDNWTDYGVKTEETQSAPAIVP